MRAPTATRVRYAERGDARDIARLHRGALPDAFLTRLGDSALRALYRSLISDPRAFVIVAEADGRVVGFVTGAPEPAAPMARAYRSAALAAGPRLLWPPIARRALRAKRDRPTADVPTAEMLTFGVDPAARRSGIGRALVEALSADMRAAGARGMHLVANRDLEAAARFYSGLGFTVADPIDGDTDGPSIVWVMTWRS